MHARPIAALSPPLTIGFEKEGKKEQERKTREGGLGGSPDGKRVPNCVCAAHTALGPASCAGDPSCPLGRPHGGS